MTYTEMDRWVNEIKVIMETAQRRAANDINSGMIAAYWEMGRSIVENEQNCELKAQYGKQVLTELSKRLTLELGRGYSKINLEKPEDMLRQPYVFEFLGIREQKPILERDLEAKLIRHIEDFLLELGRGFMFVGSQQRVTIGNTHYYVDMVFYNKILKAYVLIDLKMTELKPEHAGQMNAYLNYFKAEVNDADDNPPVGIILCSTSKEIVAEYALGGLSNQVFASSYVYYIPKKEQLINEVKYLLEKENGF